MASPSSRRFVAAIFCIFACAGTGLGGQISPRACSGTVKAKQGDTCASLAQANGITVSQFLLDNPNISSCSELVAGQDYCITEDGLGPPDPPINSTPPSSTLEVSPDGSCGNGFTCVGSTYGDCCSEHGYCGSASTYCQAGCQAEFGKCEGSGSPGSTTPPTVSTPTETATETETETVTKTSVVFATVWTTATSTATQVVVKTSTATSTSTQVVVKTSTTTSTAVVAPITQTVIETSTRKVTKTTTSTVVKTATSIIVGGGSATKTETIISTSVVAGACSPTKPDSPITSTRPPVTTTRPPQGAPSPTLPGTSDDCRQFYKVRESDDCSGIAKRNGISVDQFTRWNPSISSNPGLLDPVLCSPGLLELLLGGLCQVSCDGLWPGYYVCVAV